MKLRLNKLMAGVALACGALTLVACGDGGTPDLLVTTDFQATVSALSAAGIAIPKSIVAAAKNIEYTLTDELIFPKDPTAANGSASAPAGSKLTLSATTEASPAIASFTITTPAGGTVTGTVIAGSCKFSVKGKSGSVGTFEVDGLYAFSPCALTLDTSGTAVGADTQKTIDLLLGKIKLTSNQTYTITVTPNQGSNSAAVSIGGVIIGNVSLPTGATGGTGAVTITGQ